MNIYEYFACFTKLPIRLDDIRDQALEYGIVQEFQFIPVDINPNVLMGKLRLYEETLDDGSKHKVAQIFWSSSITNNADRRLICCKEILHVFDEDEHTARSIEAVGTLIDQIVIPPSSGISASAMSDQIGMLHAVMVLLPRDALIELLPVVEAGRLSVEDVANLADIPEPYARLALSPVWQELLDKIN